MKRKRFFAVLLSLLVLLGSTATAWAYNGDITVYVTKTGSKYHKDGCRYLSRSQIAVSLEDAVAQGYGACSVCHPPALDLTPDAPQQGSYTGQDSVETEDPVAAVRRKLRINTPPPQTEAVTPAPTSRPTAAPTPRPTYRADVQEVPNEGEGSDSYVPLIMVGGTLVGLYVFTRYILCGWKIKENSEAKKKKETEEALRKEEYERKRAEYMELYGGRNVLELCSAPMGMYVGEDGLPAGPGKAKWGQDYTVYVSKSGSAYHCKYGCSGARISVNYTQVHGKRPCAVCKPHPPEVEWYVEYVRIWKIKKDYDIE